MRAAAMGLVVSASFLCAARARAECNDMGVGDIGYGFAVPLRECRTLLHFDVEWGLTTKQKERGVFTRVGAELGVLQAVGPLHLGPVVSLAAEESASDQTFRDFHLQPRLRTRLWLDTEWVTLDAAIGPSFMFHLEQGDGWDARQGAHCEIGPTIHGVAGVYGATEYLVNDGGEYRMTVGIRMTVGAAAVLGYVAGGGK